MWLGVARLLLGDEDQGIADIKKAIAISPNRASHYNSLASKVMGLHREQDALEVWKELRERSGCG